MTDETNASEQDSTIRSKNVYVCLCLCACRASLTFVRSLTPEQVQKKCSILLLSSLDVIRRGGPLLTRVWRTGPSSQGRRRAEMCSCLMSKWLVSLFASQIVKLDIKFYERVPGPVLVSSVLCFLFSPFDDDIGGSCCCCCSCCCGDCCCCCCCHTNLSCACIWSRRKFWCLTRNGSWSGSSSNNNKSWGSYGSKSGFLFAAINHLCKLLLLFALK